MLLEIMIMHEMMMKLQNFGADWILQLSDFRQEFFSLIYFLVFWVKVQ